MSAPVHVDVRAAGGVCLAPGCWDPATFVVTREEFPDTQWCAKETLWLLNRCELAGRHVTYTDAAAQALADQEDTPQEPT